MSSGGGGSFGGGGGSFGGGGSSFAGGGGSLGGGGSFVGGSGSFAGGSGSASGGTGFAGGLSTSTSSTGFSGGITTGTGTGTGRSGYQGGQNTLGATSTGGVSSANPFASYYANPLAAGASGVAGRSTFGSALYANINGTGTMSGAGGVGAAGGRPGTTGFGGSGVGFGGMGSGLSFGGMGSSGAYAASTYGRTTSTTGTQRAPAYASVLGFSPSSGSGPGGTSAAPSALQTSLQQMLTRSAGLQSSPNIQVVMEGATVVLRGSAADDHDRRLAEGLVRLTPGVHDVRNELQVRTAAGAQAPPPTGQVLRGP